MTTPVAWPMVLLKELVVDTQYGTSAKSNEVGHGQPVLRMNNLTYEGRFDLTDVKWVELSSEESQNLTLRHGDLLFNRTNSRELVGKTGVWDGPDGFTFAGYLVRVRFQEQRVLPEWVSAFMNSPRGKTALFHMAKPSINMANISATDLLRLRVPVAPLEHQRRVIAQLEKVEAIRRMRMETIGLTEELLRSTFLEMFGDPVMNSKGWAIKSVSELCESKQYGTAEKANTGQRGLPVLRMNNITYAGDIDLTDLKWVELSDREASRLDLREGDILFNRVNSHELVGKTAAWHGGEGFTFAGYLIRLRFHQHEATGDYVATAMNMPSMKRRLMAMAKPSINMANISGSDLDRVHIPVPPIDVQRRFDAAHRSAYNLRARYQSAWRTGGELLASLVQCAFSSGLAEAKEGSASQLGLFERRGR